MCIQFATALVEDCKIALILTPQVHCNLRMIGANGILLWEKEIYSIEIAGIVTIPAQTVEKVQLLLGFFHFL